MKRLSAKRISRDLCLLLVISGLLSLSVAPAVVGHAAVYAEDAGDGQDQGSGEEPGGEDPQEPEQPEEPEPEILNGWQTIGGKVYYYKDNVKLTGWQSLDGHQYYFNGNGERISGVAMIGSYRYYFDENGIQRKGTITTSRVIYYSNQTTGRLTGLRLRVKALKQRPKLPAGCEIVSWTMMANYAGIMINKMAAARAMPRSSNPNKGFIGTPYRLGGRGQVVWPKGLVKFTRKYFGSAVNMTGCSYATLQNKLWQGHVVMAWVRPLDGFSSHTVAVVGFDSKKVYYCDPWKGKLRSMKKKTFMKKWKKHKRRALSW